MTFKLSILAMAISAVTAMPAFAQSPVQAVTDAVTQAATEAAAKAATDTVNQTLGNGGKAAKGVEKGKSEKGKAKDLGRSLDHRQDGDRRKNGKK